MVQLVFLFVVNSTKSIGSMTGTGKEEKLENGWKTEKKLPWSNEGSIEGPLKPPYSDLMFEWFYGEPLIAPHDGEILESLGKLHV